MQATVELPDEIYRRTQETAQARGLSVDTLIAEMLDREIPAAETKTVGHRVEFPLIHSRDTGRRITLPLIHSDQPRTLDLSEFDFDDLLA